MELRRYWQIIIRYWFVVVILGLIGVAAAVDYYRSNRPVYLASTTINIAQTPSPNDQYSGIYSQQSSEYATDDLMRIITGNKFLNEVSSQLKEGNLDLSADEIKEFVVTERRHRELLVIVQNPDQKTTLLITQIIANTMESRAAEFLKPRAVVATVVDYPNQAKLSGGRTILLAVVRVLAGVLAGIGLGFLLAYLDNSIKTKQEAQETLGLPVLGLIPAARWNERKDNTPPTAYRVDQQHNIAAPTEAAPQPVNTPHQEVHTR